MSQEDVESTPLTAEETAMGRELGVLPKEEGKEESAKEVETPAEEAKAEPVKEEAKEVVSEDPEKVDEASPEQYANWSANERALYQKQKKFKQRAQKAEQALADKEKEWQRRLEQLERGTPRAEEPKEKEPIEELQELKKWRDDFEAKQREKEENDRAQNERAQRMNTAFDEQLEDARMEEPDADKYISAGNDLIQNVEKHFPRTDMRRVQFEAMLNLLRQQTARAHELSEGEWTGPQIIREIGKMHPQLKAAGKSPASPTDGKKSPALSPEVVDRLRSNTKKPSSSASVSGGGGERLESTDDVTAEQLAALPTADFDAVFSRVSPRRQKELLAELQ